MSTDFMPMFQMDIDFALYACAGVRECHIHISSQPGEQSPVTAALETQRD